MPSPPDCIGHWSELEDPEPIRYRGDGVLHPLGPGDSVAFPAGTGICHTFLNNTVEEVRLLVVGEKPKPENRIRYPLNPAHEATRPDRWLDPPARPLGTHDGRARIVRD